MENFFSLSNGSILPKLGLGTSLGDNFDFIIEEAILAGYRLFDSARIYENEKELGIAFKKVFDKGLVKRDEIFITSKYWNSLDKSPTQSLNETLEDLQTTYVDNLLIHWPIGDMIGNVFKQRPLHEVWKELETLVDAGKIKNLGVCNFNTQILLDLLSYAKHKPVINQIELHPYLQQKPFRNFLKSQGILPQAWNPLSKGNFTHEVPKIDVDLFSEKLIKDLSEKYNKTIGQIILSFEVSEGISVIPKTANPQRLKENYESISFKLEEEDIEKMRSLERNLRFLDFKNSKSRNYLPIFE